MNLVATVISATRVDLTWTAVPGATTYVIMKGTAPGNETSYTSTPPTPSFADGHDLPGTQVCYKVKVNITGQGVSNPSNEQCVTTPTNSLPTPTNVVATATSSTRVQVTWTASTGATKYYVYQSTAGGPFNYANTVTTTSYTAANLTASTSYCYQVQAVNANGTSAMSTPPACAGTFILGLEGWWKFDEDGVGTTANDSSGFARNGTKTGAAMFSNDKPPVADNKSTITFPGATGDAVTVPNNGAFGLSADFTVSAWVKLPTAVSGTVHILGKRVAGCGAINWELAQNSANMLHFNGGSIRSFGQSLPVGVWTHVAVSRSGTNPLQLYINGASVGSGSYTLGAQNTATLQFGNSGGCGNSNGVLVDDVRIYSRQLSGAELADIGTVPPAPTNLVATAQTATQINLTWNASANATKYLVYLGTAPGNEAFLTSVANNNFADGHLQPSTQYSWQVAVVSHGLISNRSNEALATTHALPNPPTGLTATAVNSTKIHITWTAVPAATKYFIFQSVSGGAFAFKGSVIAPATAFDATGLTTGTMYSYRMQVVTPDGTSGNSATVSATTP